MNRSLSTGKTATQCFPVVLFHTACNFYDNRVIFWLFAKWSDNLIVFSISSDLLKDICFFYSLLSKSYKWHFSYHCHLVLVFQTLQAAVKRNTYACSRTVCPSPSEGHLHLWYLTSIFNKLFFYYFVAPMMHCHRLLAKELFIRSLPWKSPSMGTDAMYPHKTFLGGLCGWTQACIPANTCGYNLVTSLHLSIVLR